ncbi:uncharacterized protein LOC129905063 [Solanum dulcamara]|uniref:uncharacterized protein LOC129905063 n=1 Tax=Solanum dulcamara TaxID=45834 RepID=UPI00248522B8|nr:uncharacterized protein LOC129905063 [Solanum dulcamara]
MTEEKEIDILFNQVVEGKSIAKLSARQIHGLLKLFAATVAKLYQRKEKVNNQHQPFQPQISPSNFKIVGENISPLPNAMDDLINDIWFVETMATNRNYFSSGDGNNTASAPAEGDDISVGDNDYSKVLD